ncbi:MAG: protease modulator HflC [Bacillota bacterium]
MRIAGYAAIALAVIAAFVVVQAAFIIDERQQAVILQFGQHVRTIQEPGLHLKLPFIQNVFFFDRRILMADGSVDEYLTLDKKRLLVDHISRWRIEDPLLFYQTVRTETGALARLEQIIGSKLRQEIARHNFIEIIREQRETIMATVTGEAKPLAERFGIALLDVRVKRLDLPTEVQDSVFARMEAERRRIAMRYRAEGEEKAREVRAEADKEREIILATAYREAQGLRGEGDARSTRLYAEAFGQDPDFYGFLRRMEAYEKVLEKGTTLLLDSRSELFRFLTGPGSGGR